MIKLKTAEEQLRERMEKEGWKVVHKGWPDFACVRDGEMVFVEVKGYRGEMLRKEQHFILTNMAKLGLDCFKWTPNGGFERITEVTPLPTLYRATGKKKGARLTPKERWDRLSLESQEEVRKAEAEGEICYY